MRIVEANGKALLISASGEIQVPESFFLNAKYDNPTSRATVSLGLRLLNLFVRRFEISLPKRALEANCLYAPELVWLSNLAFRPIEELESMTPQLLLKLGKSEVFPHRDRAGAVSAKTARSRLGHICDFLDWYFENILTPRIRSVQLRAELRERYRVTTKDLREKIQAGGSTHPTQVRSLPTEAYVGLIREAYINPEQVFCSAKGAPSPTMYRDRAIFLLACEGMRPGAIGNLVLADFLSSQIRIVDNVRKRGTRQTEGTPVQKGARSNKQLYNSEHNMTLWPWTTEAIHEYIKGERAELLSRRLRNISKGFLFLENQYAGPIASRKTISLVFTRTARMLLERGLLTRRSGDTHVKTAAYKLSAYTLRHSSATFYVTRKGSSDRSHSEMKERFGWTPGSKMPNLYARRANMDAASVDTAELWEALKVERQKKREGAQ